MDFLAWEESVGDTQAMVAALFQKALAVVIHLLASVSTETGGPGLTISSHSGVEVTEEIEGISACDPGYRFIQSFEKLVLVLGSCAKRGSAHADGGGWAGGRGSPEVQDPLCACCGGGGGGGLNGGV